MVKKAAKKPETELQELKPWQRKIYDVVFGYETVAGRLFDVILLWTILLSVVAVMLESVKEIDSKFGTELRVIEWILTVLFSIEYIARILSSPRPRKYAFSFMGIVDLLSLIPTYLSIFIGGTHALSIIRAIRLIRVFRILKLTHFMGGAEQLGNALYDSRHKIVVFLGSVLCTVVIMGTLLYLVEGGENGFTSIPRSIYWAIVTITTVGYGDIAPQTVLGQAIASALMIIGYAIIAVPTGIVTSELVHAQGNALAAKCAHCDQKNLPKTAKFCFECGEKT